MGARPSQGSSLCSGGGWWGDGELGSGTGDGQGCHRRSPVLVERRQRLHVHIRSSARTARSLACLPRKPSDGVQTHGRDLHTKGGEIVPTKQPRRPGTAPAEHGWAGRLGMRSFLGSVAESLGISKKKHSAPPARTPGVASPRSMRVTPSSSAPQVIRATRGFNATRRRRASWRRRSNGSSSPSATPLRLAGHRQMSRPPRPRPRSPCMICTRARRW